MLPEFWISSWISDASAVTYKRVVVAVSSDNFEVPSQAVSECVHVNITGKVEIVRSFGQFLQQLVYCLAVSGAEVADFEVFDSTCDNCDVCLGSSWLLH